jgi:hypothetical protein
MLVRREYLWSPNVYVSVCGEKRGGARVGALIKGFKERCSVGVKGNHDKIYSL